MRSNTQRETGTIVSGNELSTTLRKRGLRTVKSGAKKTKNSFTMNNFELRDIADETRGLFINGVLAGLYSDVFGISQFSGNKNQIFDETLCVEFLRKLNPSLTVYSAITSTEKQFYLQVSYRRIMLSEGVQKIHKPLTTPQ